MIKYIAFILMLFLYCSVSSQALRLEEIMKGDEYIGNQPENHRWSYDGQMVYFEWNPENEKGNSTYFWKTGMQRAEKLPLNEVYLSQLDFKSQADFNTVYYLKEGVLYSFDKTNQVNRRVFHSTQALSGLSRGSDDNIIFFRQGLNVLKMDVKNVSISQITNFKQTKEKEKEKSDKETFLSQQQKELFEFVRETDAKKEWNKARTESQKEFFPKEYFYEKSNLGQINPSPDGAFVTFIQ